METPSYYAVIPADVRYSAVTPNAKLLYGELTCLTQQSGFCWASNGYLAKLYDAGERTVSRWLSELEKAGFILIEAAVNQHGQRKIFIQSASPILASQKWQAKNGDHNTTSKDNTTSDESPSISPKPKTKASSRATLKPRLADFLETSGGVPPVEWGEWAHQQFGWGVERISFEWDDFSDYWNSGNAVGGGRKSDWPATWRSHCRRNSSNSRRGYSTGGKTGSGLAAAFAASVAARHGISPAGSGVGGGQAASGAGENTGAGKPRPPVGELAF